MYTHSTYRTLSLVQNARCWKDSSPHSLHLITHRQTVVPQIAITVEIGRVHLTERGNWAPTQSKETLLLTLSSIFRFLSAGGFAVYLIIFCCCILVRFLHLWPGAILQHWSTCTYACRSVDCKYITAISHMYPQEIWKWSLYSHY